MHKKLEQIRKNPRFEIKVPGSKSLSNRALLVAALADGKSVLKNFLHSDDTLAMSAALTNLGIEINEIKNTLEIFGKKGKFSPPKSEININNAGTAMRFLTGSLAFSNTEVILTGNTRMCERPIKDLTSALIQLGAKVEFLKNTGYPPLKINKTKTLTKNECNLNGGVSSQYLSALLIASTTWPQAVKINIEGNLVSKTYIELTKKLMEDFGSSLEYDKNSFISKPGTYKAREYYIEADASSASYFWGIAALNQGKGKVIGLKRDSLQGDIGFLNILEKMGCEILEEDDGIIVNIKQELKPLGEINLNHMPDSAMTVAVLAAATEGVSKLIGLENLRVKETDRLKALSTEISKLGINIKEHSSGLIIEGKKNIVKGAKINTYDDHRMAMCFAVLATKFPNIEILDAECVSKTYPNFWLDLESIY